MQPWRQRAERLKLNTAAINSIVEQIAYVGDGEMIVRREHGFEAAEIEDMMLDHSYERCRGCRWFKEVGEMLNDNNQPKQCDECEPRN
jgi:hypothetical protein